MIKIILEKLSNFVRRAAFCFSGMVLAMALAGFLSESDEHFKFFSYEQVFTYLAFALCFALSFMIADFVNNNTILKRATQFVLTMFSVFMVFIIGSPFNTYVDKWAVQNPAFSMMAIMFYAVIIYCACALVYLLLMFVVKKVTGKDSQEEYKNVYKKD